MGGSSGYQSDIAEVQVKILSNHTLGALDGHFPESPPPVLAISPLDSLVTGSLQPPVTLAQFVRLRLATRILDLRIKNVGTKFHDGFPGSRCVSSVTMGSQVRHVFWKEEEAAPSVTLKLVFWIRRGVKIILRNMAPFSFEMSS